MMMRVIALAALLMGPAAGSTERFGIFAGHNLGHNREPLKFAERDAERVAGVFKELGGMDPANIRVLKAPRRELLETAFRDLEARARALPEGVDAIFFLYYSGHGDERNLMLGNEELPLDEVKARFDAFPAKLRVGLFDACQSGAITRIKGARVIDPFVRSRGVNGEGNIYITSSSGDENSQEADHLEASFFTHHLTSALRGAADVSGDRKVTLMEAYNYAFNHTVAETGGTRGGTQHPNARFRMDLEGDIILTDVASSGAGIRFGKGLAGEYLILDGNASVMAEVNKDARSEVMVALEPGDYSVFKKEGGAVRRASLNLKAGETHSLDERAMALHRGVEGKVKGWTGKSQGRMAEVGEEEGAEEEVTWKRRRFGMGLGFSWPQGLNLEGDMWFKPWEYLALHLGYSRFYDSMIPTTTLHQAKAGLEFLYPASKRIELFSAANYSAGRIDDGFKLYENSMEFACPDWSSSDGRDRTCSIPGQAVKTGVYRSFSSVGLELGTRFFVYPSFALSVKARMSFHLEPHFMEPQFEQGMGFQPGIIGVETWF